MRSVPFLIYKTTLLIFSLIILIPGIGLADIPDRLERNSPGSLLTVESYWVDSVMNELTLSEKIGQLFMVAAYSNREPAHIQDIVRLIKKHHIGGLIFFQGNPDKQAKLTNIYQNYSKVPLMIGMDAEWGLGMRLDSVISYPRQMTLGAIQNDSLIYRMGLDIAGQLRRLGVHINFAPVVDVNNNPDNPVIGSRSFGEDRHNVARKGIAYMNGLQDNYVLSVAKHFPGHGDTDKDSHKTLPVISHDSTRLDSLELYPFKRMIQNGVGGMMVAHLQVPAYVSQPNRPTTLSKNVITSLLREQLGFGGLVFTDALNMQGVTKHFSPGEVEAEALKAGNDVLLYPQEVPAAIAEIKRQVRSGQIDLNSIEESCRRILSFKYWSGMDTIKRVHDTVKQVALVSRNNLFEDLNRPEYKVLNRQLIKHALTVVKNKNEWIPLRNLDTLQLASLSIGSGKKTAFQDFIDMYADCDHYFYQSGTDMEQFAQDLHQYDAVIASLHGTSGIPSRRYGMKAEYSQILSQLSGQKDILLVNFGNPYGLEYLDQPENYGAILNAYNDDTLTQKVAAQGLLGAFGLAGQLPVTVNDSIKLGTGTERSELHRLEYTLPEEVGMNGEKLGVIDSIAHSAIDSNATPGCQVLVARKGKVIYHKTFGYHTYLRKRPVKWNDLYDIASVTKVVSSVPSLMHLYDEDTLSLDSTLSDYLPYLDTTNKADLVLRDVLTHQAGLKAWIPFYYKTLEPLYPKQALLDKYFSEDYPFRIGSHAYMVKNIKYKDGVYSSSRSENFPLQVAENLYLNQAYRDSIYRWIDESELLDKKEYVYSDLGYYYVCRIIEKLTGKKLEDLVSKQFYSPLGAYSTGYKPLSFCNAENIVPTENDMAFRRQLLRGYVHDPGAAMMGGVCGHAGVFSNANDLAKIMQMYLNKGYYGGKRYFQESTLELFSHSPFKKKNGNRRAIGFDKPVTEEGEPGPTAEGVSARSFGHSGFTGTIAWVDPEEEVVYVFMSNRIHPDQDNLKLIENDIRTKIQKAVYEAIRN